GVSPYTSTFVLAQTYVFGKQLHGFFSCGPATISIKDMRKPPAFFLKSKSRLLKRKLAATCLQTLWQGRPYSEVTAANFPSSLTKNHSYTYGLLDLSTCVGLRYG